MAQQATYVGSSVPTLSSSAVSTITVTAPSGLQTGDFMIAYVTQNYGWLSVNQVPSGWSSYQYQFQTSVGMAVYYKLATSADVAGSTTYTWTFNESARTAAAIMAFRGLTTGYQIAASNIQGNTASTSRTAPSVTPNTPDTMLVTFYAVANGTSDTLSTPTGMTPALNSATGSGSSGVLIGAYYELLSASTATGTQVATSGSSISAASIGSTFALIPRVATPMAQWHFDESTWNGTSGEVIDSSGNGYNGVAEHGAGTASSSPALTGTTAGTCGYGGFNGSTQYVQLPSSLPHVGSTFTVTAWIKATSYTNGRLFIDDENYNGYALSFGDLNPGVVRFFSRNPYLTILDAYATLNLNQWYFVAGVMDAVTAQTMSLYIVDANGNLVNLNTTTRSSFSAGNGANAAVGGNADGAVEGGILRFQGNIDEVTVYPLALNYNEVLAAATLTHACSASAVAPNHYAIVTPGTAVNCQAAAVTIDARSSNDAAVATTNTISLSTSSGHGDWTLTSGNGTFTPGGSNTGTATYTFAASDDGTVVLALKDTYAETVTINATDGTASATSGTATAAEDGPLTFVASGFRFTNGANAAATIATQAAGVKSTQSLALQAIRTDTSTGACTTVFASGQTANVNLGFQCNNPTSCVAGQTFSVTNSGTTTAIASNPATGVANYTSVPLTFSTTNAEAPIALTYTDAGQVTLYAKYTIPLGNGAASANAMTGSGQFVVQPYTLKLSNIKGTASGSANPGATTATGTVFLAAGQPFTATVTALNYQGSATPNFGQEATPATVALTPTLVLPSAGHDPAVSGAFSTAYAGGSSTGTAFTWPEVGIVSLTPTVANYLSSGTVTGAASGNVGRFVPNSFTTALNSPVFGTGCSSGGFTYLGQSFSYTAAPVITATAVAVGGTTTQNYTGSLMRVSNSSLNGRTYTATPASPALNLTGLPATTADPVIADLGNGSVTLTFSAGSGITFARGTPVAPFNANIALSENVIDLDGVAAANPVTFNGSGSGIYFSTSASQVYGRLALRSVVGSELLDLPMQLIVEGYAGPSVGWTVASSDVCTTAPAITFSNYQPNLSSGHTCVRDSGSPGASGAGCTAAAGSRYNATAAAGNFNLILAAPGSGNNGAVTVTASAPSYLQYLWSTATGTNANPTGVATFGVFPGSPARVYQREVY